MTFMWQEEPRKPYYRFQTDERVIYAKMKRRKKFSLSSQGLNCDLWVFSTQFNRLSTAKKALKTLTGKPVKFDQNENIYYSE
jgi:hypothetical protein